MTGATGTTERPNDFWVSARQMDQLEALIREVGSVDAQRILRNFSGGGRLEDVARFLTRREAASLVILLTVVATTKRPYLRTA